MQAKVQPYLKICCAVFLFRVTCLCARALRLCVCVSASLHFLNHVGCSIGVQYLESKGILHRDLALRNLLVSASGTNAKPSSYIVKVGDFGLRFVFSICLSLTYTHTHKYSLTR